MVGKERKRNERNPPILKKVIFVRTFHETSPPYHGEFPPQVASASSATHVRTMCTSSRQEYVASIILTNIGY
jgi:hypothetical protein